MDEYPKCSRCESRSMAKLMVKKPSEPDNDDWVWVCSNCCCFATDLHGNDISERAIVRCAKCGYGLPIDGAAEHTPVWLDNMNQIEIEEDYGNGKTFRSLKSYYHAECVPRGKCECCGKSVQPLEECYAECFQYSLYFVNNNTYLICVGGGELLPRDCNRKSWYCKSCGILEIEKRKRESETKEQERIKRERDERKRKWVVWISVGVIWLIIYMLIR